MVLLKYRGRLFEGVFHDVKQRFVGSVFGLAWAMLFPLMQLGIYATLYAVVFKIRPSGLTEMGYVVLVFSGLVPLLIYSEAINSAASSLTANKSLLLNTVFPAELIPVRAALAAQTPSLIGLLITLILGYALGRTGLQAVVMVPILWLLLMMFAVGLGWMLSLISLIARDIQQILVLITMMMFFLSPFAYTPDMVPEGLKPIIYANPLSYFVLPFQQVICYGSWPDIEVLSGTVLISLITFAAGFQMFRRSKHIFFDYA